MFLQSISYDEGYSADTVWDTFRALDEINMTPLEKSREKVQRRITSVLEQESELSFVREAERQAISVTALGGKCLQDHQLTGVIWMLARLASGKGLLLADDMGTGKMIQVVWLLRVLKKFYPEQKTMIVCPQHLISKWKFQINDWFGNELSVVTNTDVRQTRIRFLSGSLFIY